MNQKEAQQQLKTLRFKILRTHTALLQKRGSMAEFGKRITPPVAEINLNREDMANYMIARCESDDAHKKWVAAQLNYFRFFENQKNLS
jgi:hypothetical protein